MRHATHKYVSVWAYLMEWNERSNVGKDQALIEQIPCDACDRGSNWYVVVILKFMLQAHNGLNSLQSGVSQIFLSIYKSQTCKNNVIFSN